jgi:hypothetical protein
MAGVLQTGVEQQAIQGFILFKKRMSDGLNLIKVGQIRQQHAAFSRQPAEGLISSLLTAADHGEPVPLLLQPFGGETADTAAGSGDQPVL